MSLLERAGPLESLRGWQREAESGAGRLVWLSGEAGGGKTSLLRVFAAEVEPRAKVLIGSCDPLSTPTPLGPLLDVAVRLDPAIDRLVRDGSARDLIFRAVHAALRDATEPHVLAFEDVHWADQATLDLLQFLGRRLEGARVVLLATFRHDEVGPGHPLRIAIGDLATAPIVRRLELEPLSRSAVAELARGSGFDVDALHARTGGNPFFVSEVLASSLDAVPASVRDAVHARVARLDDRARAALEAAAAIGSRIEPWLLADVEEGAEAAVDDCIAAGVLTSAGTLLAFRHELAREAVLSSLSASRRRDLHRRILETLRATPTIVDDGLARIAHVAEAAGDADAVLRFAPDAARLAARLKAHREAAAQYARALRFAPADDPESRADLLEAHAYEGYLTSDIEGALASRRAALDLRSDLGDERATGENLRWISRLSWFAGRNDDAHEAAEASIRVLEPDGDSLELGWAYSNLAQLRMLAGDEAETTRLGQLVLDIAVKRGDPELESHALNNVGNVRYGRGDVAAHELLDNALQIALDNGFEEHAARAYTNLVSSAVRLRRLELATRYLDEGIAYAVDHDLDAWHLYMLGWRALLELYVGRWDDALDTATGVLAHPRVPVVSRIVPLVAFAHAHVRRGGDGVEDAMTEARGLAESTGELQRLAPVAVAMAEAAWLGRCDVDGAFLDSVYRRAVAQEDAWLAGELAAWSSAVGRDPDAPTWIAAPYRSELAGDSRGAADAWLELGCRFDAARVLTGSDAEEDLLEAFAEFALLGASAAQDVVRRRLHELGLQGPPTGPRPSTLAHPAQLTRRQQEVLELMAEGLSNAEIAGRLFRAKKTVEHHVSAVLMKMEVQNRTEAVREAIALGWVEATPGTEPS